MGEMTKKNALKAFKTCVESLDDEELGRLLYHRKIGTKVLCGEQADIFVDWDGGG